MEDYNEKQERSLPISARVDVVALAEVAQYWVNEGHHLKSISQLVNWSLDLLKEILAENHKISPTMDFVDARRFLVAWGLTQASHDKRAIKKIAAATRFAMNRREGYEPSQIDPYGWSELHNKHSVQAPPAYDRDMDAYNKARLEKQKEMHEQYKRERDAKISSYKENDTTVVKDSKRDYVPNSSSFEEIQQRDAQQDNELDELIKQRKGE